MSLLLSLTTGNVDAKPRLYPYTCTTNSNIVVMVDKETLVEIVALDEFHENNKSKNSYGNLFFIAGLIVGVWL